ncbi:MAG TPA: phage tail protein [Burkholderiales bacterium]|nr:phage tail protein [Burkholderiales bacterium]
MAVGDRVDPLRGYNFEVSVERTTVAGFRECSGLTFTIDPVEYRNGDEKNLHVRKLTGLRNFKQNIGLRRGFTRDKQLYLWYKNLLNGIEDRRNGAIVLMDEQHKPVLRWEFENGWIAKWEGPMLNATSNDVVIENLEICVERVELR